MPGINLGLLLPYISIILEGNGFSTFIVKPRLNYGERTLSL